MARRKSVSEQLGHKKKAVQWTPRLRDRAKMEHRPTPTGTGRWHNKKVLWASKEKAKRKRKIAAASRKANRAQ